MLQSLSRHIATELEAKYYWASAAPKKLLQELLEKSLKSMENCTWRQAIYNLFRCDLVSVIIIMHQDMQDHILWISSIHKHCYFMGSNLTELVFHFDYWLLEYCTRQKRIQLSIVHIYFLQYVINHSYHQKWTKIDYSHQIRTKGIIENIFAINLFLKRQRIRRGWMHSTNTTFQHKLLKSSQEILSFKILTFSNTEIRTIKRNYKLLKAPCTKGTFYGTKLHMRPFSARFLNERPWWRIFTLCHQHKLTGMLLFCFSAPLLFKPYGISLIKVNEIRVIFDVVFIGLFWWS